MKKRIGNDIHFTWTVKRKNGELLTPEDFTGKECVVELIDDYHRRCVIDNVVFGEGTVSWTFWGKDQRATGAYTAVLSENRGAEGMVTIDTVKAVVLVSHSYQEEDDDAEGVIEAESVELESEIGQGIDAYTKAETDALLAEKQDVVEDLDTIRSGADAGATAYQKPQTGIPSTDMSSAVQTSLGKADSALQTETDPTVPAWAKAQNKPTYTAQEVGALPDSTTIPSALSDLTDDATHRTVTDTEKTTWNNKSDFSGSYNDLSDKPTIPTVPTNVSAFVNDAGYITEDDVDDVPTANSDNPVKSGGVQNELALGAVYDVTAKNPEAGHNNDGKWESLSALLSDANLNTLIPTAYRKGGMSIKFVQTSDNKYVQYRLMANAWSTTVADWQGVDEEPIFGSENLVTSSGVASQYIHLENLLKINTNLVLKNITISDAVITENAFIGSDKWMASSNKSAAFFKVKVGDRVTIQAKDSVASTYALLSNTNITIGATPSYINGEQGTHRISQGETQVIDIQTECFLYVFNISDSGIDAFPQSISISFAEDSSEVVDKIYNSYGVLKIKSETIHSSTITVNDADVLGYAFINQTTNKWIESSKASATFFKVFYGDSLTITAKSNIAATYALLKSPKISIGDNVDYIDGELGVHRIEAGSTIILNIETDCYLYIFNITDSGTNVFPQSIVVSNEKGRATSERIEDIERDIVGLQNSVEPLKIKIEKIPSHSIVANDADVLGDAFINRNTNKWMASSNPTAALFRVFYGDKITITAKSNVAATYALLKNANITINADVEYIDGETEAHRMEAGETRTLNITTDCYLYIFNIADSGADAFPSSVVLSNELGRVTSETIDYLISQNEKLSEDIANIQDVNSTFSDISNKLAKWILENICVVAYSDDNIEVSNSVYAFGLATLDNPLIIAQTAVGLAKLLASGYYNEDITGFSETDAKGYIHRCVVALASNHKANIGAEDGWGLIWQSPMHVASAASCVVLFDDIFTTQEKLLIKNMVLAEVDYVMTFNTKSDLYWKDENGVELTVGDTKEEEDYWNAMVMGVAMILYPDVENIDTICEWFVKLNIIGGSRPADLLTPWKVISGFEFSELQGSNFNDDGTTENHGRIHPHYMCAMEASIFETFGVMAYNKYLIPIGAFYNKDIIAKAFYSVNFVNTGLGTPYVGCGGTIYQPADWNIYYPQGNDWSSEDGINKMTICEASFDKCIKEMSIEPSCDWDSWASLHISMTAYLQSRHPSGYLYEDGEVNIVRNRREVSAFSQITTALLFIRNKIRTTLKDDWASRDHYQF